MHVTILAIGTRGDIQPCVALGRGLQAAGHAVCLATQSDFEPFIRDYGLDFRLMCGCMSEKLRMASVQQVIGNGDSMLTFGRFTRRSTTRVGPLIQEVMA